MRITWEFPIEEFFRLQNGFVRYQLELVGGLVKLMLSLFPRFDNENENEVNEKENEMEDEVFVGERRSAKIYQFHR